MQKNCNKKSKAIFCENVHRASRKVQNEFSVRNVDDLKNGNLCLSYRYSRYYNQNGRDKIIVDEHFFLVPDVIPLEP